MGLVGSSGFGPSSVLGELKISVSGDCGSMDSENSNNKRNIA